MADNKIIYADKLQKAIVDDVTIKGRAFAAVMRHLQAAPAVDAVEVPPIKIGDIVYFAIHGNVYRAEVYFLRWEHHKQYGIHSEIYASVGLNNTVGASFDDFGKTVFVTREEAEMALAKMDGGNEDG